MSDYDFGRQDERADVVAYLRRCARRFAILRSVDATTRAAVLREAADAIDGLVHIPENEKPTPPIGTGEKP